MTASFPVLKRAMGVTGGTGPGPSWGEMMGELWPIISSPLSSAGERLLLDVIHHNGGLRVAETEELPHSLSPDDMLKSLAVQALARWTRLTYLTDLRRLELTAASSALQDVIRAVIQTAIAARPEVVEADAISEEEPEVDETDEGLMWSVSTYPIPKPKPKPATRRLIARPVGRFGNLTLISGQRARRSRRKEEVEFAR
jgi:hypothetical protein